MPDEGLSWEGRIEGFEREYNGETRWVEWSDDHWLFADSHRHTTGPTYEELEVNESIVIHVTTSEGDEIWFTIHGGLDEEYDLDDAIADALDRYGIGGGE